jgi:ribonucleotide monophosphatase NagD (HAD superfamily)
MVGDSLITDIKGANQMGVDGMLISMGNHREELSKIPEVDLPNFFNNKGIIPTFISPQLFW